MASIAMFLKWRNASYPANILFRCGNLKWAMVKCNYNQVIQVYVYGFRCLRPIQKTLHMSIHCPNHPKSGHSSWIWPIEVAKFGVGLLFSKSHFGEIDNVARLAAELKQVTEEIEEQRKLLSQDCRTPEVGNHRNPPEDRQVGMGQYL